MQQHLFSDLNSLRALCLSPLPPSANAVHHITEREGALTKPPGSLGRLEELTAWLGSWQHRATPRLNHVQCIVFAGNHGVTERGVSAWPAAVTTLMVKNFREGGAAINQLALNAGAELSVIALEGLRPTHDFTLRPAMTERGFLDAVAEGFRAVRPDTDLLCLGELGIGNTTVAAALAAALFGGTGADWAGPGAGSDEAGMARKRAAIDSGLKRHQAFLSDPLTAAQCLGGYELAAMLGAALAARQHHVPVLLDGFVSTAAVAPLHALHDEGLAHCQIAHCSAEPGHKRLAQALGQNPLLDLGLRLGEGSGAALAVPLLRAALACHLGMHTFAEAGIAA
ncbi:nicotinate-nucleotide--dimethylbenzimidazole phosphoribosyltransferase [Acetobacter sp.]|uniref:nicotinate-nucleotide--dimethylbenzimidazole phosphoribosyltransferase n=1 Tax=Acetobacter sp. TaxID=440 RepID=UPI0039EBB11E